MKPNEKTTNRTTDYLLITRPLSFSGTAVYTSIRLNVFLLIKRVAFRLQEIVLRLRLASNAAIEEANYTASRWRTLVESSPTYVLSNKL